MPNARVLSEKQAIVEELTRRLSSASAGVFVDYRGITVAEDTQLRRELAQNAVQYSVVKNTLTKFAVDKVGLEGLDPVLNGTTSMATSEGDPIALSASSASIPRRWATGSTSRPPSWMERSSRAGDRRDRRAALQGRAVCQGARHHARTHHQPGRCSGPDSREVRRLCGVPGRERGAEAPAAE